MVTILTWSSLVAFLAAVALGAMVSGATTALLVRRGAVHGVRRRPTGTRNRGRAVRLGRRVGAGGRGGGRRQRDGLHGAAGRRGRLPGRAGVRKAWLASRRRVDVAPDTAPAVACGWWRAATGAVTQLSNPKVAVFMVAFFRSSYAPMSPSCRPLCCSAWCRSWWTEGGSSCSRSSQAGRVGWSERRSSGGGWTAAPGPC